jgi:hypothetical protein
MKHLKSINQKAHRIEGVLQNDVVALQARDQAVRPALTFHSVARSCSRRDGRWTRTAARLVCASRWSATSSTCHITCFWPAHVPDLYNHAPDWTAKCASAQKDWRKIDLVFP